MTFYAAAIAKRASGMAGAAQMRDALVSPRYSGNGGFSLFLLKPSEARARIKSGERHPVLLEGWFLGSGRPALHYISELFFVTYVRSI
jgi:hypothetical protein